MVSEHKESMPQDETERMTVSAPSRPQVSETGKRSMRGMEKVGDRLPINYEYAGRRFSFEAQDPKLHNKYPEGVDFDSAGFPDFSPYATKSVEIDMTGDRVTDTKSANAAEELERTPREFTWHHHQDTKTMQLVPQDLHGAVRHTGGVAIINERRGVTR
jgi:filamentous hemagglutinin